MAQNLSVSWDEYQKNICKGLGALQQRGEFVDMTLAADGHHVKVHQMVLSLVSPFIKDLITSANCPHPVIFLNRVSYQTMQAILEYAYSGEVLVRKDNIGEFLEACKELHIKGLDNLFKNIRSTIGNKFSEFGPERDKTETTPEDDTVSSKRKRPNFEETFNETAHFDDDDDVNNVEAIMEVEVETLPNLSAFEAENEKPVESEKCTENTLKEQTGSLQYSVSCQGKLQIVLNRYLYAFRHLRKNNQRFWRCVSQQTTGCPANITTAGDTIIRRSFPHNHSFHDAQILKRVKRGNVFTSLKEVEAAAVKKQKSEEPDLLEQAFNNIE